MIWSHRRWCYRQAMAKHTRREKTGAWHFSLELFHHWWGYFTTVFTLFHFTTLYYREWRQFGREKAKSRWLKSPFHPCNHHFKCQIMRARVQNHRFGELLRRSQNGWHTFNWIRERNWSQVGANLLQNIICSSHKHKSREKKKGNAR